MVASRHPSFRRTGAPSPDRQVGLRPVSSRSSTAPAVGGCRDQRTQLRLVVDNTVCASPEAIVPEVAEDEPGALALELRCWVRAVAELVEARWRLSRQRWINRHPHLGSTDRLAGLGPVVALVAFVVFGGLFALRVAQESSPRAMEDAAGHRDSVAAVATSTSSAGPSGAPAPAGPGAAVVVVHPGDSLWSIAVDRYPDHDPRAVVDAFVEVNGPSMIRSGQQLIVPQALLGN